MDKKTFAIGILSISALILFVADTLSPKAAQAYSIKDRDYQLVTTKAVDGGDSLYVTDNRTGQVAVFAWDAASRSIKLRDRRLLADCFQSR